MKTSYSLYGLNIEDFLREATELIENTEMCEVSSRDKAELETKLRSLRKSYMKFRHRNHRNQRPANAWMLKEFHFELTSRRKPLKRLETQALNRAHVQEPNQNRYQDRRGRGRPTKSFSQQKPSYQQKTVHKFIAEHELSTDLALEIVQTCAKTEGRINIHAAVKKLVQNQHVVEKKILKQMPPLEAVSMILDGNLCQRRLLRYCCSLTEISKMITLKKIRLKKNPTIRWKQRAIARTKKTIQTTRCWHS